MATSSSLNDICDADIFDSKFATDCKIAMKWSIKEETLKQTEKGIRLSSEKFPASKIPGVQYHLAIHPYGRKEDDTACSIYLYLTMEEVKSIGADYTLSIKSISKKLPLNPTFLKTCGFGAIVCTHDELFDAEKKYIVDGVLTIELEGTLKPRGLKRKAPTQSPNIVSQKLWERDTKDITLFIKEEKVMIHKWVLTARSSVFEAMFNSNMKEAQESQIIITDFTKEIVNIGVEFCYERDIMPLINDKNASELLRFSDKYDMADMKAIVESFLIENISETNVCEYANMSIALNCKDLRKFCICFLMKFINPQGFFNGMDTLDYEILKEIIRRSVNPIAKAL